jgi:hypothetical protein
VIKFHVLTLVTASLLTSSAYADVKTTAALRLPLTPGAPRSLTMRRSGTARTRVAQPAASAATPMKSRPTSAAVSDDPDGYSDLPKVTGSLQVGFAFDGAAASDKPALDQTTGGLKVVSSRGVGFGNLYAGSRGIGLASLSTFLASNFQFTSAQGILPIADALGNKAYFEARSAWAQVHNFLGSKTLAPLRLRLGRQYSNSVWPTHFAGATIGWDTEKIQAQFIIGTIIPDFSETQRIVGTSGNGMASASVVVNFRHFRRALPLVFAANTLTLYGTQHASVSLAYQPRTGLVASFSARSLGGALAQEHASMRATIGEISHLSLELTHRHGRDWQWDPTYVRQNDEGAEARRYLELGPVTPQLYAVAKLGTVLVDNIDLFGRAAFAVDRSAVADRVASRPSWFELAAGTELRLRRAISLSASSLFRDYRRTITPQIVDEIDPQPIPNDAHYGEQSVLEAGVGTKVTLGVKRFSTSAEFYVRRTRFAQTYIDRDQVEGEALVIPVAATIAGGRIKVDAWISPRLRVLAQYELSSRLKRAPEITGFNSLRVGVEGTF